MIDLRPIETKRTRRGYALRCPHCGEWSRFLLIVDSGELICRRCYRCYTMGPDDTDYTHLTDLILRAIADKQ